MPVPTDFAHEYADSVDRRLTDGLLAALRLAHPEMETFDGWQKQPVQIPLPQEIKSPRKPRPPEPIELPRRMPQDPTDWAGPLLTIMREVAAECGLSVDDLRGPRRFRTYVRARSKAIKRMRHETDASLCAIARRIRRDHTTVLHYLRQPEPTDGGEA